MGTSLRLKLRKADRKRKKRQAGLASKSTPSPLLKVQEDMRNLFIQRTKTKSSQDLFASQANELYEKRKEMGDVE